MFFLAWKIETSFQIAFYAPNLTSTEKKKKKLGEVICLQGTNKYWKCDWGVTWDSRLQLIAKTDSSLYSSTLSLHLFLGISHVHISPSEIYMFWEIRCTFLRVFSSPYMSLVICTYFTKSPQLCPVSMAAPMFWAVWNIMRRETLSILEGTQLLQDFSSKLCSRLTA